MKSVMILVFLFFIASCASTSNMPKNTATNTPQINSASIQPAAQQPPPAQPDSSTTSSDGIVSSTAIMRSIESQKSQTMATRSLGSNSFVGAKKTTGLDLQAIQFEYNSAKITDKGIQQINELAGAIKQYKNDKFEIIGHTDTSGSEEYNLSLSKKRAAAVISELKNKHGINTSRLSSVGKGEDDPIDKNNPSSAENRRVEILYVGN